jgi:hypothetical protein
MYLFPYDESVGFDVQSRQTLFPCTNEISILLILCSESLRANESLRSRRRSKNDVQAAQSSGRNAIQQTAHAGAAAPRCKEMKTRDLVVFCCKLLLYTSRDAHQKRRDASSFDCFPEEYVLVPCNHLILFFVSPKKLKYVPWMHADDDGTDADGHVAAANASATDARLSCGSRNDAPTASHAWASGKFAKTIARIPCFTHEQRVREILTTLWCLQGMMMGPYSPAMPFSPSYSPEYGYDQHAQQQQHGGDYPGPYFQGDHRYEANAGFREDFHHNRDERRGRDHHGRFKTAEEMTDEGTRITEHAFSSNIQCIHLSSVLPWYFGGTRCFIYSSH